VKNLLITLISILLLSSFITSCGKNGSSSVIVHNHKGENTFYRWGEGGYYNWMRFGDKETQPMYQGQVKDGKPNGLGVLIYPDGSKYVGEFKNGKWNGTEYDRDGTILSKIVYGRRIKQLDSSWWN
tara:strand:- start:48 stop:425 length:378 start_codon:yes stop_codon:yes gene_type:complete